MNTPFQLVCYSGDYVRRGVVSRPLSIQGAVRVGKPGELSFTVPVDERRLPSLLEEGARVRLDYRYDESIARETIFSGAVQDRSGTAQLRGGTRTFTVYDDWADIFNDTLGIPNPTGSQTQQGDEGAYYTLTGAAETVLKGHVQAAVTRVGKPLTIPATAGRGASVVVGMRMHPLADRLFPTISTDTLIVRVLQIGDVRTLVVTEPTIYTRELTQQSGIVVSGDPQISPPTITRAIIGAGGEQTARLFRFKVNAGWEATYKRRIERFLDARDVAVDDPDLETILTQRWTDAQAEGGPRGSVSAVLAETRRWRWGRTFKLGDKVTIRLAGSDPLADYVREVQFGWDLSGRSVVPIVGDWAESQNDKVMAAISKSMRAQRIEQGSR